MSDLISRDDAIKAFEEKKQKAKEIRDDFAKFPDSVFEQSIYNEAVKAWRTAINIVKELPTVDAVEVVRCKECKHFDSEDDCDCPMDVRYSDFFCKMGERRTDEEIIHQYHERHKEVLKEMSMPVGRNVMDALRERRTDV